MYVETIVSRRGYVESLVQDSVILCGYLGRPRWTPFRNAYCRSHPDWTSSSWFRACGRRVYRRIGLIICVELVKLVNVLQDML